MKYNLSLIIRSKIREIVIQMQTIEKIFRSILISLI